MASSQETVTVWTIGHSTRSWEVFLNLLQEHGIVCLVDIRRWPTSRRHPQFCREAMTEALAQAGIAYVHMESLGGYRQGGYRAYMETVAFRQALEELIGMARRQRTAILCAEALPWRCHRWWVSEALTGWGVHVVHILDRGTTRIHQKSPFGKGL